MSANETRMAPTPITDAPTSPPAELTAEAIYASYDGTVAWADALSAHVERTIGALRSTATRLRLPADILAVNDAIAHLGHYVLELGYEAERDY